MRCQICNQTEMEVLVSQQVTSQQGDAWVWVRRAALTSPSLTLTWAGVLFAGPGREEGEDERCHADLFQGVRRI